MLQGKRSGVQTGTVGGGAGAWKRRWAIPLSLVIMAGAGLVVEAVRDSGVFELEGDAVSGSSNDWDKVYADSLLNPHGTTSGARAVSFVSEGTNLQASIFQGGGSKDPIDIDQWAWKDDAGGLPDKDNLLDSFAARYTVEPTNPATWTPGTPFCGNGTGDLDRDGINDPGEVPFNSAIKCELLFFGSDRYDNSGDAQQGFWFFQNEITLGTRAVGGGQGFDGVHKAGDLLVISDFSNGGTKSTITIYRWDPVRLENGINVGCVATNKGVHPTNPSRTVNDPTCGDANLRTLETSAAAKCDPSLSRLPFCGIVNPADGTESPWPFLDKRGNDTFAQGELYEGGVNLTLLGLAGQCFASVASETRSSTATTAVLKDFVLGAFAACKTGLVTTPSDGSGVAIPKDAQDQIRKISIGSGSISVTDSAVLTIEGVSTWTGTLAFHLCGPFANTTDTCTTGGVAIGSPIQVSNTTAQPILSAAATVTSAGRYCWRGNFTSGTAGVPDAKDDSVGECFVVTPVQPAIITSATGSVALGNPIDDTATLTLTATQPGTPTAVNPTTPGAVAGGSITFSLYGPSETAACTTPIATRVVPVAGSGSYTASSGTGSGSLTPTTAGKYYWVASYSGSAPNTLSATGKCGDNGEESVVTPLQPAISTSATPGPVNLGQPISDTASLTGTAPNAVGTITFKAYGPDDASCTGTAAFTSVVTVGQSATGTGQYGSGNFTPTAVGTYRWIASYSGDLPNTKAVSGACNDENEASIVQQLQPTISTLQTFTIRDSATISVVAGGGPLAGSVRFRLYNNATCDATTAPNELLYDSNVLRPTGFAVSGTSPQTVQSDVTTIVVSKPVLSWLVEYTSTNQGHKNVTSACNVENASLTINNGGGGQ